MATNKVTINTPEGEEVLIDLTGDTLVPEMAPEGFTFHTADGEQREGEVLVAAGYEFGSHDVIPIEATGVGLRAKAAMLRSVFLPRGAPLGVTILWSEFGDTNADQVFLGSEFTSSSGLKQAGTFTITPELTAQNDLIARIKAALQGKAAGGGSGEPDPSELYQRVEYIESAEEETYPYIITDIFADNDTGVEVIASFPILQDRIPMGSRNDSGATRFYCVYPLSASTSYYGFNTGNSLPGSFAINTIYRCQTNFLGSRMAGMFDSNGNRKSGGLISSTLTKQTVPVAIFGYNSAVNEAVTSKREYKLYSARISQGFEVVREYIPCYRKSDGVVGLYEKFTGAFLTNEGEGSFTKGADVAWDYDCAA